MDNSRESSLRFSWCMLGIVLSGVYLAERDLLRWKMLSETDGFAATLLAFHAMGLVCTCYNWLANRKFKISTLCLIGLTTFVSIAMASPSLAVASGSIFIAFELNHTEGTQSSVRYAQWFAIFCGASYVAAAVIQNTGRTVTITG